MNRGVLAYPIWPLPSRQWLATALLYWDTIHVSWAGGDIHPADLTNDFRFNELQNLGVFSLVDPLKELGIQSESVTRIDTALAGALATAEVQLQLAKVTHVGETYTYYNTQIPPSTIQILRTANAILEDGLLGPIGQIFQRLDEEGPLHVKKLAQTIYEAIQAAEVAQSPRDDGLILEPVTYLSNLERAAFISGSTTAMRGLKVSLMDALPVTRPELSFQDVIAFREKCAEERFAFRKSLDNLQKSLNTATSVRDMQSELLKFEEDLKAAQLKWDRVTEQERVKGWNGSISTLMKVSAPSILSGLASQINPEAELTSSVLGLIASGALLANEVMLAKRDRAAKLIDLPMSYVLKAEREL
jgi:hypothetical protein